MGAEVQAIDRSTLHEALVSRIDELRRYVGRKIPRRLRHAISVDDVLQEVWIAAYRTVGSFRPEGPNAVDRWLTTIASSKLIDALKYARRLKRGGRWRWVRDADARLTSLSDLFTRLQSPQKTPSRDVHRIETAQLVMLTLARLNDARRVVILMHYVEGLSQKVIAERTGRTEAAVKDLLFRGRRELRRHLGPAAKYFSDARSSTGDGTDEPDEPDELTEPAGQGTPQHEQERTLQGA
jgi:RNA polymerase sigma factor (sigma-70 family)